MPYVGSKSKLSGGWQAGLQTRTDRLSILYSSRLLSDVIFYVGPERIPVEAHKLILMMNSTVFEEMFDSGLGCHTGKSKKTEVVVPDVNSSTFETMLKFMYLGSLQVDYSDIEALVNLLIAAAKYQICGLVKEMVMVVVSQVNTDNVLQIYHLAEMMRIDQLAEFTLDYICRYATEIFTAVDAHKKQLSLTQLENILSSDKLNIDEVKIFKYAINWATECCKLTQVTPTPVSIRSVLSSSKVISQIRFGLMSASDITEIVTPLNILSSDQLVQIYAMISKEPRKCSTTHKPDWPLNNNVHLNLSRRARYAILKRFSSKVPWSHKIDEGRWNSVMPYWQCISFTVDKTILILGVSIFGLACIPTSEMYDSKASNFTYDVRLIEGTCFTKVLLCKPNSPDRSKIGETVFISFGCGTRLQPGVLYTLAATVKTAGVSYIGNGGKRTMKVPWKDETVTFEFQTSPPFFVTMNDGPNHSTQVPNGNSSNEFEGEFPEIFFTL